MNLPDQRSDEDLASTLAQGDPSAGAALAHRYVRAVYDFAARVSLDPAAAVAYTEAAIERALDNVRNRPASLSFRAWLFGIARDEVLEGLRQRARPEAPEGAANGDGLSASDPVFYKAAGLRSGDESERRWAWQSARGQRPRDYSILDLLLRQKLGQEEIAEIASLSRNGVYAVLGRLRGNFEESFAASALYHAGREACPDLNAIVSATQTPGPALRREISRHAESCPRCRDFRASLPSAVELFEGLDQLEVPAADAARLYPPLPGAAAAEPEAPAAEPEAEAPTTAAETETETPTAEAEPEAEPSGGAAAAGAAALAAGAGLAAGELLTPEPETPVAEPEAPAAEPEAVEAVEPESIEAAEPEAVEVEEAEPVDAVMAAEEALIEEVDPGVEMAAEAVAGAALTEDEFEVEVEEPDVDAEVEAAERALNREGRPIEEPPVVETLEEEGIGAAEAGMAATAGLSALEGDLSGAEAIDLEDVDSTSVSSSQPPLLREDEADLLDEEAEAFEEEEPEFEMPAVAMMGQPPAPEIEEEPLAEEAEYEEEYEELEDVEDSERDFAPLSAPLGTAAMSFPRREAPGAAGPFGAGPGAGGPPLGPSWASEAEDEDDGGGGNTKKYLVYAAIGLLTAAAVYIGIALGSSIRGGGGDGGSAAVTLPTPVAGVRQVSCPPSPVTMEFASSVKVFFAQAPAGYRLSPGPSVKAVSGGAALTNISAVSQADNTVLFVARANPGASARTDQYSLTATFTSGDDSREFECVVQVSGGAAAPTATATQPAQAETETPTPTSTPTVELPTATPTEVIFVPLPTATPEPTETPAGPTDTPTPTPTNTPSIAVGTLLSTFTPTPTPSITPTPETP